MHCEGPVYCVGPHSYKMILLAHSHTARYFIGDEIAVEYNLFAAHGYRVKPRPGKPNAHGWKRSRRTFASPKMALVYITHLLRATDARSTAKE